MVITAVMVVSDSEWMRACTRCCAPLTVVPSVPCPYVATDDHNNDETAALYGIVSIYCSLVFVYLSFDSIICECHAPPAFPATSHVTLAVAPPASYARPCVALGCWCILGLDSLCYP